MSPEDFSNLIEKKRIKRMNEIDNLPQELRILVHQYGYNVVRAFLDNGVIKPRIIKHLVETVLNESSPTRGAYSNQGIRNPKGIDNKV